MIIETIYAERNCAHRICWTCSFGWQMFHSSGTVYGTTRQYKTVYEKSHQFVHQISDDLASATPPKSHEWTFVWAQSYEFKFLSLVLDIQIIIIASITTSLARSLRQFINSFRPSKYCIRTCLWFSNSELTAMKSFENCYEYVVFFRLFSWNMSEWCTYEWFFPKFSDISD